MDSETINALLVLAFYFAPSIVALARGHQSRMAIIALNLLLGWTIIGWIIALIWALAAVTPPIIHSRPANDRDH